jgi:sodium/potassium-transporting ATPase subunit alpha
VILLLVVLVTAIFSFAQETKAANVMEGFKKLAPQICKVIRNGEVNQINATELVVGDIVQIRV